MFQIKDFRSVVASMVNYMRATQDRISDFTVGGVARTLVEAPAIEIDELYQQMFHGLLEGIPTAIYNSFEFALLPAATASGRVTFSVASPAASAIVIPAGTVVRVPGAAMGYATTAQGVIAQGGTSVIVKVLADATGASGNALGGTITAMDAPITGVSVTNVAALTSGRDIETEDERKDRFRRYILTMSRGPAYSIEYGAGTAILLDADGDVVEYVVSAQVVEPYLTDNAQPLGVLVCYIYNGVDTASASLVSEAQKLVDGYYDESGNRVIGWKAAGVLCTVQGAVGSTRDVTMVVTPETGYTVAGLTAAIQSAVGAYIQGLGIGAAQIRAELIAAVMAVPGVYNCALSVPSGDVSGAVGVKPLPGTITVTAA